MGKIICVVKIKNKNQITIPKDVKDFLNVKEGDNIIIILQNNQLILKSDNINLND